MKKSVMFPFFLLLGFGLSPAFAEHEEMLLGIRVDNAGIEFQVASGGCTDKENFRIEQKESLPVELKLIRTLEDLCEMNVPYGTFLRYTYKELGLNQHDRFHVANRLGSVYIK